MRFRVSRLLLVLGLCFGLIGVGMLIAAGATAVSSQRFQATAEKATGRVVAVDSHEECDTDRRSDGRRVRECHTVYDSTIEFSTADGKKITFESNVSGSQPPRPGDSVEVLYPPDDPQRARVAGVAVWVLPIVFGGIGIPFTLAGVIMLAVYLKGRRKLAWLQDSGRRVQGQILGVQRNRHLRINNVHPWRVHVGWRDPASGAAYEFASDNLMSDPTPVLAGAQTLEVLIDPADPQQRHWVDLTPYGLSSD
ncbi:DUF3592 domain-containing protein [Microlunatus soli]|uniref:DUF3592 domain-containing protein n=1 Tax=Microlunatus soli TaxID=630515 RepID=UPI0012F8EA21|nr:DUF3592 domain-containing protein [Microlunatus soli]